MQDNVWPPPMNMDVNGNILMNSLQPGASFQIGKRLWRKGKWTDEEEIYTKRLVSAFNQGLLPLQAGTTLRCFLSEKLNCDPMRISKKFAGSSSIGKQIYQPCEPSTENTELMKSVQAEIDQLEETFIAKVEITEKSMLYPSPTPPMWYQGDSRGRQMPPFVYGVQPEYIPTMVVPYNGAGDYNNASSDMYLHMGMGLPQQRITMPAHPPQIVHPPPPEPKESRRNFVVPEMKQIQEAKQVLEAKQEEKREIDSKETSDAKQTVILQTTPQKEVNRVPPVVAEARDWKSSNTHFQEKQQLELLEIPPLVPEHTAQRAQPKHKVHRPDSKTRVSDQSGDEASELLINFFKAANDRDCVETSDSSSNSNSLCLEGKSDSNNGNSGSEEKSSDSSHIGGNSGSDGDNSSQEEESSGTQDKSENSSQDDQQHRSRSSRVKVQVPEGEPLAQPPILHQHNRWVHNQQPMQPPFQPYTSYQQHGVLNHHYPHQPQHASHPANVSPHFPHTPMSMQNISNQYPMSSEQYFMMNAQQQAAWRHRNANSLHRPRPGSQSGSSSSSSGGGGGGGGTSGINSNISNHSQGHHMQHRGNNGRVIDTPTGPMFVWHEMNSSGVLAEKAVPFAFMAAAYRAGKDRPMNMMTATMPDDQIRQGQMARSRFTERAERRNQEGSLANKRQKTVEGSAHQESTDTGDSSSPA